MICVYVQLCEFILFAAKLSYMSILFSFSLYLIYFSSTVKQALFRFKMYITLESIPSTKQLV